MTTRHRYCRTAQAEIFYRDAGPENAPVVLLLHGFPTSSHMFRTLIPELATRFRVVAPDMPGFGLTKAPRRGEFNYTFDNIATVIQSFTQDIGLDRFAMYCFDYGAPVGFRIATRQPDRITAIISQNGNAYEEGLSDAWGPWQTYWREPTPQHREACRESLSEKVIRDFQYLYGTDPELVAPDNMNLDLAYLRRMDRQEIQLDLILDYQTNLTRYPEFQAYFRERNPPTLVVWGKNDASFTPRGAEMYRRDVPDAEIHLLDTGHFALETHVVEIGKLMRDFLERLVR